MPSLSGTLDAVNETSKILNVPAKEKATYTVADNNYLGAVVLEKAGKGLQSWEILASYTGAASVTFPNDSDESVNLRLRATAFTHRQFITFSAVPDDGLLKLSYGADDFQIADEEGAAELQVALRLITGLEDVTVTGTFTAGFVITFVGVTTPLVLEDNTSTLEESASPVTVTIAELDIEFTLADATDIVYELRDKHGNLIFSVNDSQKVVFKGDVSIEGTPDAGVIDTDLISEKTADAGIEHESQEFFSRGNAAGQTVFNLGLTKAEGFHLKVIDETISLASLGAKFVALTTAIPSGAVIVSAQLNVEALVVAGGTTVKVALGINDGDVDKYGITTNLTKNQKINTIPDWAVLSAEEQIDVCAVVTNGSALGDTNVSAGSVRVRIVYLQLASLTNAA